MGDDRQQRGVRRAGALVALLLVAVACSGPGGTEVRSEAPRASVPAGTVARGSVPASSVTPGVTAIDGLALDLYRRVAARPGNVLFSPYSVEVALAMTRNGAKGETREQMDAVLHAGRGAELDEALNALDLALAARPGHKGDEQRNGDVELALANALFGQKDTPFEAAFLDELSRNYGAGMRVVDFKTSPEPARTEINDWVEDRTNDKIVDLLPNGSIDALTRLVLTNAVYFKAPWTKKFQPVGPKPFTRADGSRVDAAAMSTSKAGTYREGPGWKAAEIPYLGGELAMDVIVPDDLAAFESSLNSETLDTVLRGATEPLATLQLPKFTFRSSIALKEQLAAMGMPLAFADGADLSGITTAEQLRIRDVFHQAFIAVDEEGTEAAAATAVVIEAVSGPCCKSLVVDRPFLFAIRDVPTGVVLFLGRVADPTAS